MQLINSTVIRELSTTIFPGAYIRGPISKELITGCLYPGAYIPGTYTGSLYPGTYIRRLITECLILEAHTCSRWHISWGLISGGL